MPTLFRFTRMNQTAAAVIRTAPISFGLSSPLRFAAVAGSSVVGMLDIAIAPVVN